MFKMILMRMRDTTALEQYLQRLPSNDVGEENGLNWKIISINILILFSWLAVRQTHDDESIGKTSIVIVTLNLLGIFWKRKT